MIMKFGRLLVAGLVLECLVLEALALAFGTPAENAQVKKGSDLFARRCSGCHALDNNREGPRLRGVYGRKAGGVPEFTYSDALKKLNLNWDDTSLDRWLTDPDAMAPDTDMAFRLSAAEERKAVIAWLRTQGSH
jgi:cytochrome c